MFPSACFARSRPTQTTARLFYDGRDVIAECSNGKVFSGEAGTDDIAVLNQITPMASYVALDGSFVQDRPVIMYDNQVLDGLGTSKLTVVDNVPIVEGLSFFGILGQYSTPHNNPRQNYNITIKNLEMDGNCTNNTIAGYGIFFKHASNVLVDNCYMHDWVRSGVSPVYGCGKFDVVRSQFRDNQIAGVNNNSPITVLDCDFYGKGGIYFEGLASSNSVAVDNRFHGCNTGISSDVTAESANNLVERNIFDDPTGQVMTIYNSEVNDNVLNTPVGNVAGIYANNCSLRRNIITGYYIAVKLVNSDFQDNQILNAIYAMSQSSESLLENNIINATFRKTYMSNGGNTFRNNTFSGNGTFSNHPSDIFIGNTGAPDTYI